MEDSTFMVQLSTTLHGCIKAGMRHFDENCDFRDRNRTEFDRYPIGYRGRKCHDSTALYHVMAAGTQIFPKVCLIAPGLNGFILAGHQNFPLAGVVGGANQPFLFHPFYE
jgi:hypothetical protein